MANQPNSIILNILYPVIVAVILFMLGLGYNKFEAYETLLKKLPQVENDLKQLNELHEIKERMEAEYISFKRNANGRIKELEDRPVFLEKNYIDIRMAKRVNNRLKIDSIAIVKNLKRTQHLKEYHN